MSKVTDGIKRDSNSESDPRKRGAQTHTEPKVDKPTETVQPKETPKTTSEPTKIIPTGKSPKTQKYSKKEAFKAGIHGGVQGLKDFGSGAMKWGKTGFAYNEGGEVGRYIHYFQPQKGFTNTYEFQFGKEITKLGKDMANENKSFSYKVGATTAALVEGVAAVALLVPNTIVRKGIKLIQGGH